MAKTSGLGAAVSVADATQTPQNISDDVNEFSLATPRAEQDTTGVDVYARQRLLLLADATISLKGVVNPAANMSHAVLSTISSTSVIRGVVVSPTASTHPQLGFNAYFSSYDVSRASGADLTWSSEGALADGATPTWS